MADPKDPSQWLREQVEEEERKLRRALKGLEKPKPYVPLFDFDPGGGGGGGGGGLGGGPYVPPWQDYVKPPGGGGTPRPGYIPIPSPGGPVNPKPINQHPFGIRPQDQHGTDPKDPNNPLWLNWPFSW